MEPVYALLCIIRNQIVDLFVLMASGGQLRGRRSMYPSLARRIVDRKKWFEIPLLSGTQNLTWCAIEYLARIEDRDSIPRLEAFLKEFLSPPSVLSSYKHPDLSGARVMHVYGPADYVPKELQNAAVKALLELYWATEADEFLSRILSKENLPRLAKYSLRTILAYIVRTGRTIDPVLFQDIERRIGLFEEREHDIHRVRYSGIVPDK